MAARHRDHIATALTLQKERTLVLTRILIVCTTVAIQYDLVDKSLLLELVQMTIDRRDGSAFRLLGGRDESGGCAGSKGWKSKGGGNAVSVL